MVSAAFVFPSRESLCLGERVIAYLPRCADPSSDIRKLSAQVCKKWALTCFYHLVKNLIRTFLLLKNRVTDIRCQFIDDIMVVIMVDCSRSLIYSSAYLYHFQDQWGPLLVQMWKLRTVPCLPLKMWLPFWEVWAYLNPNVFFQIFEEGA